MKNILIFLIACFSATSAMAQQDPLYAQYINNPFTLNPAYAGLTNNLNASLSYRHQWTGLEGSPVTVNANGHISLHNNTMGAGLMFVNDRIGVTTVNEIYASYAYRIKLDAATTLSFGLQAGMINFKTDNSRLTIQDPNDPVFTGNVSESKPNIGSGVIVTGDKFFVGFSVPRMLKTTASAGGFELTQYTQHIYVMGSYLFLLKEHLRFKPSVLGKIVSGAPASIDVNAAMIFHEKYTAGLLTRNFSTFGIFLQAIVKDSFRIGYAFESPTGKSVGSQFSTHEITLGIRLKALPFHDDHSITSF